MSTMTKVFVVLNTVLSVALSVLFVSAAAQWTNYRRLHDSYKAERDAAITQRQNTAATMTASLALKDEALAAAQADLSQTLTERDRQREDLEKTRSELAIVKNERQAFEAGREMLQQILDVNSSELKTVQKQNQDLVARNIDLEARNGRLNSRVLELTTNVTILTDQVRNVQEKLYACEQGGARMPRQAAAMPGGPLPIENPPGAVAAVPLASGDINAEIIEVDGGYAAINVGESSGVVEGMTFMIYREGGVYLGDLIVDRVRPQEAGGRLTTLVQGEIRRGDRVRYSVQ